MTTVERTAKRERTGGACYLVFWAVGLIAWVQIGVLLKLESQPYVVHQVARDAFTRVPTMISYQIGLFNHDHVLDQAQMEHAPGFLKRCFIYGSPSRSVPMASAFRDRLSTTFIARSLAGLHEDCLNCQERIRAYASSRYVSDLIRCSLDSHLVVFGRTFRVTRRRFNVAGGQDRSIYTLCVICEYQFFGVFPRRGTNSKDLTYVVRLLLLNYAMIEARLVLYARGSNAIVMGYVVRAQVTVLSWVEQIVSQVVVTREDSVLGFVQFMWVDDQVSRTPAPIFNEGYVLQRANARVIFRVLSMRGVLLIQDSNEEVGRLLVINICHVVSRFRGVIRDLYSAFPIFLRRTNASRGDGDHLLADASNFSYQGNKRAKRVNHDYYGFNCAPFRSVNL